MPARPRRAGRRPRRCCPAGPDSSAWFEHRLLAERGGLRLVVADDLEVRDGEVRHRDSGERLDALYLRLDVELVDLDDSAGHADRRRDLRRGRGRRGRPGQRPGQRSRRRQGHVLLRPGADRLLPGRAPAAGVGADLPDQRRGRGPDRAGPGRRTGQQAGRRPRRHRGADRAGRHRRGGAPSGARPSRRTRPAGWPRRSSRCRPTRPSTAAGCSPGTSTCGRSSTCAARRRRTVRWPIWP